MCKTGIRKLSDKIRGCLFSCEIFVADVVSTRHKQSVTLKKYPKDGVEERRSKHVVLTMEKVEGKRNQNNK